MAYAPRSPLYTAATIGVAAASLMAYACGGPTATQIPIKGKIEPGVEVVRNQQDLSHGGYLAKVTLSSPETQSADPRVLAGNTIEVRLGRDAQTNGLEERVNDKVAGVAVRNCELEGTLTSYGADQGTQPYSVAVTKVDCVSAVHDVYEKGKKKLDGVLKKLGWGSKDESAPKDD